MPIGPKRCKVCLAPAEPWRHISARGLCKRCAIARAVEMVDAVWPHEEPEPTTGAMPPLVTISDLVNAITGADTRMTG